MSWLRFERARHGIAMSGALVCRALPRALWRSGHTHASAQHDVRGDRRGARHARGRDRVGLRARGSRGVEARQALKAGLEAKRSSFGSPTTPRSSSTVTSRSPHGQPAARAVPGSHRAYRDKPEVPYTAIEPYSGQNRICRFLVTHLQGKARGSTLVAVPLDRAEAADARAAGPRSRRHRGGRLPRNGGDPRLRRHARAPTVEEVTSVAEKLEATDLSRRVRISSGGEEFRRLAGGHQLPLERLELAFRAQRRLVADAAHELKTPTAVLVGEAQEALRPDASRESARRLSRRSSAPREGSQARWTACSASPAATPRPRRGSRPSTSRDVAEEAVDATAALGRRLRRLRRHAQRRAGCRATAEAWCALAIEPRLQRDPVHGAGNHGGGRGRSARRRRHSSKSATGDRGSRRKSGSASSSASFASIGHARKIRRARAWGSPSWSRSSTRTVARSRSAKTKAAAPVLPRFLQLLWLTAHLSARRVSADSRGP